MDSGMAFWRLILLLFMIRTPIRAQEDDQNMCMFSNIQVQPNFIEEKILGKWFQIRIYSDSIRHRSVEDYVHNNYKTEGMDGYFTRRTARDPNTEDCIPERIIHMKPVSPGVYTATRPSDNATMTSVMVDTDYKTYCTRFACQTVPDGECTSTSPSIWIYSRTKTMSASTLKKALRRLPQLCVNSTSYVNMKTLPERACDRNLKEPCEISDIPVQANFDINKYAGLWYELRLYPQNDYEPIQSFTDHSIEWTKEGENLYLTTNARRSVDSECMRMGDRQPIQQRSPGIFQRQDRLLRRTVTVNVVETDYVSYSVEFHCHVHKNGSCTNPEARILSRAKRITKELMDRAIRTVQDLCVDPTVYSDVIQQTALTCTRNITRPCLFSKIPTQPNFDEYRFLGRWYLIVWYLPNDYEPGEPVVDVSQTLKRLPGGYLWKERNRREKITDDHCVPQSVVIEKKMGPGIYSNNGSLTGNQVIRKTVYTDYDHMSIYFGCFGLDGDDCVNPSVAFVSRTKTLTEEQKKWGEFLLPGLCVDPKSVYLMPQEMNCAPSNEASRVTRSHCNYLWGATCGRWKRLNRHCRGRPLGCHYYERQYWSCHRNWWRCRQDLEK